VHDAIGPFKGQSPEQHGVNQRENGRISANSKSQREHHDGSELQIFRQHPDAETQVFEKTHDGEDEYSDLKVPYGPLERGGYRFAGHPGHTSVETIEMYLRSIGIHDLKRNHSQLSMRCH